MATLSIDVGVKNLAFAVILVDDNVVHVKETGIIDFSDNGNIDVKDTESLIGSVIEHLHRRFFGVTFSKVVVENQPVMKNPVMKSVQSTIYAFFLTQKLRPPYSVQAVKLYAASQKLKPCKAFSKADIEVLMAQVGNTSSSYLKRKRLAVALVQHLTTTGKLVFADSVRQTIEKAKKNDDLCDAILQGFHFLCALQTI